MKFLSVLKNDEIIAQIPTTLTIEQAIEIDDLLRCTGELNEDIEIAITEEM